ncbi:MAG: TetR/AcrR family transcriptional regulator [Rubripirellula sp.]|nr:TetR/AcrR family transcriptional regulator [Rubripirellula sp.]
METERLSPKQQEIRDREVLILDLARAKLVTVGYLGLNMDLIAAELNYSKGTIYNHFSCKEEILLSLAIETLEKRGEMFQRGLDFEGLPRERMAAIGVAAELFVRLYPEHFQVERFIRSQSIWDKTSEERRTRLRWCESHCMELLAGVVRDGIAEGHLTLSDSSQPEELVFGLWSQTFGAYSIIATSESLQEFGILDPYIAVRRAVRMVLNGYKWHPISSQYDYIALQERIQTEVFSDECSAVVLR